ncbi:MAG: glutamine-hydrolyzing carbamoyl-phosphate synthase small subunit [Alphaproteobacteria bacterium]
MAQTEPAAPEATTTASGFLYAPTPNAVLVLADGSVYEGIGLGYEGEALGEVCFNTSITGYQEILTDPSYAGQLITFTFPHIGNVGTNEEDIETATSAAHGMIMRADVTLPSNFRATQNLDSWLKDRKLVGISGIDTRALTRVIRQNGAPNGVIAYNHEGKFDIPALQAKAAGWPGLEGMDLAKDVTRSNAENWMTCRWDIETGFGTLNDGPDVAAHVVALDYGCKHNILRCLASIGVKVTIVPAKTAAADILALNPDGIFLSNGPGDPAATGTYAVPVIKELIDSGLPLFGICLGHQMLALALGAKTMKMHQGHRGANHPVKDLTTDKVEITSMNHGFTVDRDTLPKGISETHVSLFDGTNCGIAVDGKPIFSVQYHPEASPGPQDSFYLFDRFLTAIKNHKSA